jgi:tRNA G46 methylase TrmB
MSQTPLSPADILFSLLKRTSEIEEDASHSLKLRIGPFAKAAELSIRAFTPEELSTLFVDAALFASCCLPFADQMKDHERHHNEKTFPEFIERAFRRELASISYLAPLFTGASVSKIKCICAMAETVLDSIAIETRRPGGTDQFHRFLRRAFELMQNLTRIESKRLRDRKLESNPSSVWLEHSVYRAFDRMDEILGIDYERDRGMRVDPENHERLYEGAGLGVQTSYTSLLIALDELKLKVGARFVDLGSGYGRVGLVVGIVRPDIDFVGYEYVAHRVEASQNSALQAGLSGHVSFLTQDLSDLKFEIPEADVYYMYDPFSQETYLHVFNQLLAIAKKQPVMIVTKGNAGAWIENALCGAGWFSDRTGDTGTLGIFRSHANDTPDLE